ncbi:MAG: hypothetical protein AAGM38_12335 [Pseudomonadota bacterium]
MATSRLSSLRLWGAALLCALVTASFAGPAAAQGGLCGDPQAFCLRFITPECGARLGAGALPAGDDSCAGKIEAYRTCLAAAAETCVAPGDPRTETSGAAQAGCDAEDARTLWAELRRSAQAGELEAFAAACDGRPQAALARTRAERLRRGETAAPQSVETRHGAPERGSIMQVVGSFARLKASPGDGASGPLLGSAASGSIVTVLERDAEGRFVRIEVLKAAPSGTLYAARGWVLAADLRDAPASLAPKPLEIGADALVDTYTLSISALPSSAGGVISAQGWLKRGSRLRVLERFVDPKEGAFIRFRLLAAKEGSQPTAEEGWTPEANLIAAEE